MEKMMNSFSSKVPEPAFRAYAPHNKVKTTISADDDAVETHRISPRVESNLISYRNIGGYATTRIDGSAAPSFAHAREDRADDNSWQAELQNEHSQEHSGAVTEHVPIVGEESESHVAPAQRLIAHSSCYYDDQLCLDQLEDHLTGPEIPGLTIRALLTESPSPAKTSEHQRRCSTQSRQRDGFVTAAACQGTPEQREIACDADDSSSSCALHSPAEQPIGASHESIEVVADTAFDCAEHAMSCEGDCELDDTDSDDVMPRRPKRRYRSQSEKRRLGERGLSPGAMAAKRPRKSWAKRTVVESLERAPDEESNDAESTKSWSTDDTTPNIRLRTSKGGLGVKRDCSPRSKNSRTPRTAQPHRRTLPKDRSKVATKRQSSFCPRRAAKKASQSLLQRRCPQCGQRVRSAEDHQLCRQSPSPPMWEVRRVVGRRRARNGEDLYHVSWEKTWEPAKNLKGYADAAISEYHKRVRTTSLQTTRR